VVEFDNIDSSENSTGFSITTAQNNAYVEWLTPGLRRRRAWPPSRRTLSASR